MDMVGGFKPSEKHDFVNWDDDIPNIWENQKCSKPPTRQNQRKPGQQIAVKVT